ncbi:MAG: hypothetical protein KGZ96_00370 [Clostridia bacterium]|jgi:hypothetical protein|nr:hypothetical protein [Clostridia bacterium]
MELGAIIEHIQRLPKQAQTVLLRELKPTDAKHTPAGAVLMAMQLLTALGVPRRIDLVLGEEHTSIKYLKKEMDAGRKQVPSSGILICLLVADMLAYPKIDAYLFVKVLAYFVLAFLRWYAEEHGYGKITESKIQDQLSEMSISRISIEPLGIDKWSVANDNPLTIFFRSSLGLPDPHEAINILNGLVDAKRQITLWLQAWEQTHWTDNIATQHDSG